MWGKGSRGVGTREGRYENVRVEAPEMETQTWNGIGLHSVGISGKTFAFAFSRSRD